MHDIQNANKISKNAENKQTNKIKHNKRTKKRLKNCHKNNSHYSHPPFIPPPTMLPHFHDSMPKNMGTYPNEALHSKEELSHMLTSWYMAGYHTGYYRGTSMKKDLNQLNSSFQNKKGCKE